ncbi:MAG: F0F1 ATP synthase subunit B [Bacteroidales bacterium]
MDLVTPGIGLLFWSTLFFLILLFILGKFAWPAILTAIKARNESIKKALESAERARKEMLKVQADNEKILAAAKVERDAMIKEAKQLKDKIIADAKEQAGEEARKLVANAREAIQAEKKAAINDLKSQVANLSIDIAEKILRKKLEDSTAQKKLINTLIKEADLN